MKKVIVREPVLKIVKDGTRDVEAFEASDGRIFTGFYAESHCASHEKTLSLRPIMEQVRRRTTSFDFLSANSLPVEWYYVGSELELEAISNHLGFSSNSTYYHPTKPCVGDWIGVTVEDGGDHQDTMNVFTWGYVRKGMKDYLQYFGE